MKSEKQLYQWDVNQYLTELQPEAQFVDYPMGNEVIRIETDGTRCRIPDEFLQSAGFKTCYERYSDGTYKAYSFNVLSSPKPPDYVYTAEERTTFEALVEKADAAIAEIKRRADSGEFTPKKGVDYFTEEEKTELMESVSSGAVGEFRKVVDGATTEYNDNHNLQLAKYNANAAEKLTTYDTNDEQRTSDYNRNAEEKLEAYNQNHTEKVAEYNQNAETKTAEFDSNAAALQTEVDRLRGECDNLAAENRIQENRISALMKLNKGQTYDILPEEGESASRTAPSGSKYVGVDKVGGKSIVWNQLNDPAKNINVQKGTIQLNDDGSITISGTIQDAGKYNELQISQSLVFERKQKYLVRTNKILSLCVNGHDKATTDAVLYSGTSEWRGFVALGVANGDEVNIESLVVQIYNLTQMFGAGNEPTIDQFKKMFDTKIYPYNSGEIISSTTAAVELEGKNLWDDSDPAFTQVLTTAYSPHTKQSITTGFPELHSAGTAHDEIDMDGGEIRRNVGVVDLETLEWKKKYDYFIAKLPTAGKATGNFSLKNNELCNKYESKALNSAFVNSPGIATHPITGETVWINDNSYETLEQFVTSLSGAVLQYELATPTTEPVAIPEPLQEWLSVEPGGTVTFRNADESKQLPVPNAVSWVRKLNEVE